MSTFLLSVHRGTVPVKLRRQSESENRPVIFSVESAVTKLMYLQGLYDDPDQVRHYMTQSIRGEITKS